MTPEEYKYLLISLFSFITIASLYLVFKSGFKLKKSNFKEMFGGKGKDENSKDKKGEIVILGIIILFLLLFDKFSN